MAKLLRSLEDRAPVTRFENGNRDEKLELVSILQLACSPSSPWPFRFLDLNDTRWLSFFSFLRSTFVPIGNLVRPFSHDVRYFCFRWFPRLRIVLFYIRGIIYTRWVLFNWFEKFLPPRVKWLWIITVCNVVLNKMWIKCVRENFFSSHFESTLRCWSILLNSYYKLHS